MESESTNRYLETISNIISIIFHPVFLPVYGLLIIFNAPTFMVHLPAGLKRVIFTLATINMTVVPLAVMPFLRHRKLISSYKMDSRQERLIPLSVGAMMYIVTSIIFYSYQIPQLIKSFTLAAAVASVLILLITFRWKISAHAAGMGALLACVMVLSVKMMTNLSAFWIPVLLFSGLVLSARMYLKSHNPAQIYMGYITGFIPVFLVMMIF